MSLVSQHTSGRHPLTDGRHPFIYGRQCSSLAGRGVGSHHSWPAGHWCTPQHCFGNGWHPLTDGRYPFICGWQCSSLAGRGVGSHHSWPVAHWCTPQHCFGKFQQQELEDTLQTEPLKSIRRAFRGEKPSACMFIFQTELLQHILKLYLLSLIGFVT
ncbi:hypothetical protein CsSME_00042911 [Camellia sinensis var. sinensis]